MPSYANCTLSLYCDHRGAARTGKWGVNGIEAGDNEHVPGEFPHVFEARTLPQCFAKARSVGWRFRRNGATVCPRCKPQGPISPQR
jgi:hypothetical protein